MIIPNTVQTTAAVARHYDDLDTYYREIWGDHVHHGYFVTGDETVAAATEALITLLASRLDLTPGQEICDIGCGYGATANHLAEKYQARVTGFTVSAAQAARATNASGRVDIRLGDWLANDLPAQKFDRAYAIESSEHMPDKQRFFNEAFRTLKPGGRLAVCAWLAADKPRGWEIRHLLEPICREGRLPGMGTEAEYREFGRNAGFEIISVEDISARVSRTWTICAQRLFKQLFVDPRYIKMLLNPRKADRIFALTLFRLIAAYRTKSMRYCVLVYRKP